MTRSASVSRLRSEFDDFLFAPIGSQKNGMPLSVLSALARLDVDPWAEAAKFARMSAEAATDKMASLIAALPDRPSGQGDPRTVAARLIGLLPRRDNFKAAPQDAAPRSGVATRSQTILFVMFMTFLLGAQFFMASRQPPPQADGARAPVSSPVSSSNLPPGAEMGR